MHTVHVLCEQRKWPGSRLSRADAHLVVMHVSVGVVKPVVEYFGVKTARRLFPPLPLSVQPFASNSPSPLCLHNHFEGEVQRNDAPAAATRTWISSAAARRFSNRCAAFLRSSALSAIFRLQKHWMLTAALCSTCFWRLIASTVAFAALRRDAAWILGATERVSLTVCTKATEEH